MGKISLSKTISEPALFKLNSRYNNIPYTFSWIKHILFDTSRIKTFSRYSIGLNKKIGTPKTGASMSPLYERQYGKYYYLLFLKTFVWQWHGPLRLKVHIVQAPEEQATSIFLANRHIGA